MNLRDIAQALGGEVAGSQVLAPGPGHSPKDRSLSIRVEPDAPDGFLVTSFSGDDALSCKDYVRDKLGLPRWEPNKPKTNGHSAPLAKDVCDYIYRTADGEPYHRVTRMSDKTFRQAHWTGEGWANKKPQGQEVLYRLPELLAAAPDDAVFLVEGEKDADNLAAIGLIAVTTPGGSDNWRSHFAEPLKGRCVFILPDNDAPGRKYADKAAADIPGARIINLPDLPSRGDVSDWIQAGGTASDLMDMALNPPERIQPENPLAPSPFVWTDPAQIPRRVWLYGRHLIRRYVSMTVSPGGLGKSSLLLAECVAMAAGRPILNDTIHDGPLRVWYWNGEDDQDENRRRIAAICLQYGIKASDLGDRLFIDTGREKEILLASVEGGGLTINTQALVNIQAGIIANRIDVVVIDPLVTAHRIPENDNGSMAAVIRELAMMAEKANCAFEVVHHVRKPGGGVSVDTDVNDARGASSLLGAVRSARVLNAMSKEEAERLDVEHRFQYFRVDDGKANLAPRSEDAKWFHIVGVDLQNGGLKPSDHVGVVAPWSLPGMFAGMSPDIATRVQGIVGVGSYRYDSKSPDWVGWPIATALAIDADDAGERGRLRAMIDEWIKGGALKKELRPDAKRMMKAYVICGDPISAEVEIFE